MTDRQEITISDLENLQLSYVYTNVVFFFAQNPFLSAKSLNPLKLWIGNISVGVEWKTFFSLFHKSKSEKKKLAS